MKNGKGQGEFITQIMSGGHKVDVGGWGGWGGWGLKNEKQDRPGNEAKL